jgi:CubicO group peptidase (beta-lactamase class C family)
MLACCTKADTNDDPYDGTLRAQFNRGNLAGLQACVIVDGKPAWFNAYGFADVQRRVSMTPDAIINIASVSKTVTACAVMQLWEKRKLALDEAIDRYLPFPVRNPLHATTAITARHLLAHTSSVADGPAYAQSYSCGTSTPTLRDWLSEYVLPRGRYYNQENFNPWPPGQQFQYSNVGFGLLGCAVEAASGLPFSTYCHREIFEPLGMQSTSFGAPKVSSGQQAIPYTIAEEGRPRERVVRRGGGAALELNGTFYIPNCL